MSQKLSKIEQDILSKLTVKQLEFLRKIAVDKDFGVLSNINMVLADYEKNYVFKLAEEDPHLAIKKAYSRGMAGGYTQFGRLIMEASAEIDRREEKRKEVK